MRTGGATRQTPSEQARQQQIYNQKFKVLSEYLLSKYGACLTVEETAKELRVSRDTIYKMINHGQIPSKKLRDRRVINSVDLAIFMLERDRS